MKDTFNLSVHAHEFILAIRAAINDWHLRAPAEGDGVDSTRARLNGLASDIVRLVDSADGRGWDIQDVAYEVTVGVDVDAEDNLEVLLSIPLAALEQPGGGGPSAGGHEVE